MWRETRQSLRVVLFAAVLLGALMTIEPAGYCVLISASVATVGLVGPFCDMYLAPWTNRVEFVIFHFSRIFALTLNLRFFTEELIRFPLQQVPIRAPVRSFATGTSF